MAGDPLRDAFRAELDSIISTAAPPIPWVRKDTLNTSTEPDASTGYIDLEFPGGGEAQYTFGAPAANLYHEQGQVTVRVVTPLSAGQTERDKAETYAAQIRSAFRTAHRTFAAGSRTVRIKSTAPMGGGHDEGGMWAESVALEYEIYNVG
jgi:hypothetical protein